MNSFSATFYGDNWAKILQNTDAYTEADATHGTLVASQGNFQVKVIDSTGKELVLQLADVIEISKKLLTELGPSEHHAKQELHAGLQQLAQQVKLLAKKIIGSVAPQENVILNRQQVFESIKEFCEGIEEIEEQLDAELINGDVCSENEIKQQILEIANGSLSSGEIKRLRNLVKNNKNLGNPKHLMIKKAIKWNNSSFFRRIIHEMPQLQFSSYR
jgi:hypothetical protein